MDGVDHRFKVDSKNSGKIKKEKHFQVSVHWPSGSKIIRQTRITSIETKRKKPSSFWEHSFRDETKEIKWMSLPVTGKLKDVSDKKAGKKGFSLAELRITKEDIKSNTYQLLPSGKVEQFSAFVIKSIQKSAKGDFKESKKLK